jgi:hypothetical protein
MSNPQYAVLPAGFARSVPVGFIAADTTLAKILVEPQAGAAASGNSPLYYGGASVIDGTISSTDSADKEVLLYAGAVTTTQETTATGVMATTASTITRVNGSFITDGWRVGDSVMLFAPANLARTAGVDGVLGVVTTVVAGTLTVNGTPFTASTPLAAGMRVCRMHAQARIAVPLGSGTTTGIASVQLVGNAVDGSTVRTEIKLGATDLLAVAMAATTSALPATANVDATIARY